MNGLKRVQCQKIKLKGEYLILHEYEGKQWFNVIKHIELVMLLGFQLSSI